MNKRFTDTASKFFLGVVYKKFRDTPTLILEDSSECYSADVENIYTFFDYYRENMDSDFFQNQPIPFMIPTGAGTLPQIEDMILTKEDRELLNEKGLRIFLYEIAWFYKGLPKKFLITKNTEYKSTDFCIEFDENDSYSCFELDCINVFMKKNNVKTVEVVTRDYGMNNEVIRKKYPNIKITYRENLIATLMSNTDIESSFNFSQEMIKFLNSSNIRKKFWCGNWRYADHRYLVACYLATTNCNLSWAYETTLDEIKCTHYLNHWKIYHPDVYRKLVHGQNKLNNDAPLLLDLNKYIVKTPVDRTKLFTTPLVEDPGKYACPTLTSIPFDFYNECFCAVVNESEFRRPAANISEKVVNAMKACRPFIVVSSPRSLEWLHKLGFKTFDSLWDEKYDLIENHGRRLIEIFKQIDYINSKDIDELKEMYEQVKPILKHNFERLQKLREQGIIDPCDL